MSPRYRSEPEPPEAHWVPGLARGLARDDKVCTPGRAPLSSPPLRGGVGGGVKTGNQWWLMRVTAPQLVPLLDHAAGNAGGGLELALVAEPAARA